MISDVENLPVDTEGSIAFQANEAHVRTLKICLTAALAALLCMAAAAAYVLSRPPKVAIIRTDDVRGAELVSVGTKLDIRTAEVRTALWNWALRRYRVTKSDAKEDFAQSYYFLSEALSTQYRDADAQRVAMVLAGSAPEQRVDVHSIHIPPLKKLTQGNRTVFSGRAELQLVTSEAVSGPTDKEDPTRKHLRLDIDFIVDPQDAAKRGVDDPQYQIANPLGVTITGFDETRLPSEER